MELEPIKQFEGKYVKLNYTNGFNLVGTIVKVYDKCILFRTKQADSLIDLNDIKSVVTAVNNNSEMYKKYYGGG